MIRGKYAKDGTPDSIDKHKSTFSCTFFGDQKWRNLADEGQRGYTYRVMDSLNRKYDGVAPPIFPNF